MEPLPQISTEINQAYQRYLAQPLRSRESLGRTIESYRQAVKNASAENEFLDSRLANEVAERLYQMLETVDEEALPYVQAAILYFVESDDEEHDFNSMLGFDDDAEVLNAVAEHLGHPEWKVEL